MDRAWNTLGRPGSVWVRNASDGGGAQAPSIPSQHRAPRVPRAYDAVSGGACQPRPTREGVAHASRGPELLLVLVTVVLALAILSTPVSAGPAIDLPRLDIAYEYAPPLDGHGHLGGRTPHGGRWRVVGGGLGDDDRLTLELEIRPPAISVPLEPGRRCCSAP